jgi:hypothetical protein
MRSIHAAAWLLCAVSGVASGQQVIWKCRDDKGSETFQNAPCGPDTREVRAKVYDTPRDSPAAVVHSRQIRAEMEQRNAALRETAYVSPRYVAPSAREVQRAQCASARRDALDAAHRGVTFPSREWYERRAIDACFGL